jgi:hypothetical protein
LWWHAGRNVILNLVVEQDVGQLPHQTLIVLSRGKGKLTEVSLGQADPGSPVKTLDAGLLPLHLKQIIGLRNEGSALALSSEGYVNTYSPGLAVLQHSNISPFTENRKTLLPALIALRQRSGNVISDANDRIHRTPARLERFVESSIGLVHLRRISGEGLGLLVVGPLYKRRKEF